MNGNKKSVPILWLDLETTGLDYREHTVIQLAGVVDIEGEIQDTINLFIKPFKGDKISRAALNINRITVKDMRSSKFLDPFEAKEQLDDFLAKFVNRYDKLDKFVLAGKNINYFDVPFLKRFFKRCDNSTYEHWFFPVTIDIDSIIAESIVFNDLKLHNYSLGTLCKPLEIDLDAHEAMSDILATRILYYKLKGVEI